MKAKRTRGIEPTESRGTDPALLRAVEPAAPSEDTLQKSHGPHPDCVPESKPLGTRLNMHTQAPPRKKERLDRAVMQKLGTTLQAYFDDVKNEGVPDRFKELLRQIDARKNGETD